MIRQIRYIVGILVCCIVVTLGITLAWLHSPTVQTGLVRLATDELSRGLGSDMHIGRIEYRFPAKLCLQDVYLADQTGDTLAYVGELYAHFSPLGLIEHKLHFRRVTLSHVRANVHREPDGEYNYQFLVNAFRRPQTQQNEEDTAAHSSALPNIEVGLLRIEDVTGRFEENRFTLARLDLSSPHFTRDSLDVLLSLDNATWSKDHPELPKMVRRQLKPIRIDHLQARALINDSVIGMPDLQLAMPHSSLDAGGVHLTRATKEICLHVNRARFSPQDIGMLVPNMAGVKGTFTFNADIDGRIDSLGARNLSLHYNNRRILLGDVTAVGLPHRDSLYLRVECVDLNIDQASIQDIISQVRMRPYVLPDPVRRLGNVHYRGLLEGRLPDYRWRGAFRTDIGVITTDADVRTDSLFSFVALDGRVATRRFALGRMLPTSGLGNVSLDVTGTLFTSDSIAPNGHVHAHINELSFRNYVYHDVCLHGRYDKNLFEGNLEVDDPNLQVQFDGLVHRVPDGPTNMNFDLRLDTIRPGLLHLLPEESPLLSLEAGLRLSTELQGNSLDEMNGYVVIDSIGLRTAVDTMLVEQIKLLIEGDGQHHRLLLTGDPLAARIEGDYSYKTLASTMAKFAVHHVPGLFRSEKAQEILSKESDNSLHFYIYGRQLQHLERLLCTPVRVSDYPVLKGFVNEQRQTWGVRGYVPYVLMRNGTRLDDITLMADNLHERANLGLQMAVDSTQVLLRSFAAGDSIGFTLQTSGKGAYLVGEIAAVTHIRQYAGHPFLSAHIHPGVVQYGDSVFYITDSYISYNMADTILSVEDLRLGTESHYVTINGIASRRPSDSILIELGQIDAGFFMPMVLPVKTLTVGGSLSGRAMVYGALGDIAMNADVVLEQAELCECPLGTAVASCRLDKEQKKLVIDGDIYRDDGHAVVTDNHLTAHVDGAVPLGTHTWYLDIMPDSIPLAFINHWTSAFLDNIHGTASGHVRINGAPGEVFVLAEVQPHDGKFTLPWTGCEYTLRDSCFLDSTGIWFRDMTLYDQENNPVYVNGGVRERAFKDFSFAFDVHLDNAVALNLPHADGQFMEGYILAAGDCKVRGDAEKITVNANAVSMPRSRFALTIDNASSAGDDSFITFVDHNKVEIVNEEEEELRRWIIRSRHAELFDENGEYTPSARFSMGLNMDVTPDVDFRLMLNNRTGDMIQARGEGALSLRIEETGDVKLIGTYELQSGKLGYTVANAIHKELTIEPGSTISWNGDPVEPNMRVKAYYQTTASLTDLFGSDRSALSTSNTRNQIPVRVVVYLTGDFSDPTLRFALELPSCDDAVKAQVMSVINTEEMLLRQVVYLLVFNKFYTPDYMATHTQVGLNETYSLLSSTVTGQINNWLSRLTDVVTLGIDIRQDGEVGDATAQTEYEANIQIQPIPRLVINGNVGYRYNDIQNRPFFGDLDVEYKLTRNGKLRAKAYTHMVDKYSMRQANTIQGIGLVFRHDFNFRRHKKKAEPQK